jgi:RNA polymerase sigma-70 factor (ECF subfamily)
MRYVMLDTDQDLLHAIAQGEPSAFAALYDRYASRVLGFLVRLLKRRSDAEDVLQETFLQVWSKAKDFQAARSAPLSWLFLLARSRALDLLRRRWRQEELPTPTPKGASADPAELFEVNETKGQLRAALEQLPEEQRTSIQLAFYGGLTHEELAASQCTPLGTVKTRIRLGMQRLRGILTEKGIA